MVEEAKTAEQAEGQSPTLETKTAPEPQEQDRLAKVQSRLQAQVAEANKTLKVERAARQKEQGELAELRQLAKFPEGLSEDEQQRLKALARREGELTERENVLQGQARQMSATLLSQQYGIPVEELENHEDIRDMRIAALEWAVEHPKAQTTEPAPKPAKKPSGYDTGEANVASKGIWGMTEAQFKEEEARRRRAWEKQQR